MNKTIKERQAKNETLANKPLVSFCIFAYHQEQYIREAMEGAFAQTYSPLEIILSDDCSPDRTFEIMSEMAAEYKGPHTLILNRNETNLGISAHVNKIFAMARGEWFVLAAGDDISQPQRVERAIDCAQAYPTVVCVQCAGYEITEAGVRIKYEGQKGSSLENLSIFDFLQCSPFMPKYSGARAAYRRKLFEIFGPMSGGTAEDTVFSLRARLAGDLYFIDEPLVDRRVGGISSSQNRSRRVSKAQRASWNYYSFLQFAEDLRVLNQADNQPALERLLREKIQQEQCMLQALSGNLPLQLAAFRKAIVMSFCGWNLSFTLKVLRRGLRIIFRHKKWK